MRSNADSGQGPLAAPLAQAVHDPRLWTSAITRTGLGAAIALLMTTKPGLPVAAAVTILGTAAGYAAARATPSGTAVTRRWAG